MFVAQIVLIGLVVFERKSERFSSSSRSSLKNDSLIELQVKEFLFLVCVRWSYQGARGCVCF